MKKGFCFLHIEKAAGSTLHEIFRNNDPFYYICSPRIKGGHLKKKQLEKIMKFSRPTFGCGGHSLRLYEKYELSPIIFLRDPIDRYISHWNFRKKVKKIEESFEDFLNLAQFNNFMCKKIAHNGKAKESIELVNSENAFIGFTEYFDESLLLLRDYFEDEFAYKICIKYEKMNVKGNQKFYENIKNKYFNRILKNNYEDIKLYNYFLKEFKKKLVCVDKTELNKFQDSLLGFNFNKHYIRMAKTYRRIYFKNLEKIITWSHNE